MGLPPGKQPIPVSGIDPAVNPKMAEAAGELAAWIEYLLHPESNDGPRIYRPKQVGPDIPDVKDFESYHRMPPAERDAPWEDPDKYQTVSVFEEFAGDTGRFFRAAQSFCGLRTEVIEASFGKLASGVITWNDPNDARVNPPTNDDDSTRPKLSGSPCPRTRGIRKSIRLG